MQHNNIIHKKQKLMRFLLLLFFSTLLISTQGFSQETNSTTSSTFRIKAQGIVKDVDVTPYIHALEKADLDRYRFVKMRRVLRFEQGLEVELFSGEELDEMKIDYKKEKVNTDVGPLIHNARFKLHDNGQIIEQHTYFHKK